MANNRFTPASWLTVLLAAVPGLLVVLSRRSSSLLDQLLPILSIAYLGLLLIGIPLFWRRDRRFPAWALLPAGLLAWFAVYLAGVFLAEQWNTFGLLKPFSAAIESGIFLLQIILTFILFAVLLRGQRLPLSVWLALSAYLLVNLILAFQYIAYWPKVGLPTGVIQFLTVLGVRANRRTVSRCRWPVGRPPARFTGLAGSHRRVQLHVPGQRLLLWSEFQPMGGLHRICRQHARPLPDRHPGRHAARPHPPGICPGNFCTFQHLPVCPNYCPDVRAAGTIYGSLAFHWHHPHPGPGLVPVQSRQRNRGSNPPLSFSLLPNLVHRSPVR